MDSGNNSASLQSSSGGGGGCDEEYDSRASDSFNPSAFHTQLNSSSSMFDPFANYFNPISRPQPPPPSHNYTTTNTLFSLDTDWSKTLRSDHNNNPMSLLPSPNTPKSLSFGDVSFPSAQVGHGGVANVSVTTTTTTTGIVAPPSDQPITQPPRNPKKRSRASRRAPTTVLTTDTTNFRAMVQEFTGIPAPPFTSSYFPPTTRFDIFGSAPNSVASSSLNISQPPNYLRRPFPQKIQVPLPFLSPNSSSSSSSSSSLMLSCLANNIASGSSSSTSASNSNINYQPKIPSSVTQNSNLFSTIQQNSILTSLLQSSQKYPLGGSKEQEQFQMSLNNTSQVKIGSVLEEYSMNSAHQHGHLLSGLPNLISPEQAAPSRNENIGSSSTNFHGDNKVQETVPSRGGEGMVESWICSSD